MSESFDPFKGKTLIGSLELCSLPDLEINDLCVRVDTGAKTSSVHVDNIVELEEGDKLFISFDIHPDFHDVDVVVQRKAEVEKVRTIKSSNGTKEKRYVIITELVVAGQTWDIELTLADRSEMSYLMLLGRTSMEGRFIVDPSREFILTKDASKD